jgi:hypothetical protein
LDAWPSLAAAGTITYLLGLSSLWLEPSRRLASVRR